MNRLQEFTDQKTALAELWLCWKAANNSIKMAERINCDAITTSVYELKYAGGKVIEAFSNPDDESSSLDLINDAIDLCRRAEHDAIDAATSKVMLDIEAAVKILGADLLLNAFPDYSKLMKTLTSTRNLISTSKENREDRDIIYKTIAFTNLKEIISLYDLFKINENVLIIQADKQKHSRYINNAFGVFGFLSAIFSIVVYFI